MVDHFTLGIQATRLGARIRATELVARPIRRTLGIDRALGFTIWWGSNECFHA